MTEERPSDLVLDVIKHVECGICDAEKGDECEDLAYPDGIVHNQRVHTFLSKMHDGELWD